MSLKQRTLKAVFWVGLGGSLDQVTRFLLKIILARLLLPDDFGVFAIGLFVVSILALVNEFGISNALIHWKDNVAGAIDTGFAFLLLTGTGSFLLIFVCAPLLAAFYHNPLLVPLLRVMALSFFFFPLVLVPGILLERELDYRKKFIPDTAPVIAYALVSVVLAAKGWGVWSLVCGHLVSVVLNALLIWGVSGWRLKWNPDWRIGRGLLGYGIHVVSASILALLLSQGDNLFVGKLLGMKELGFYAFGYSIPTMMLGLSRLLSRVTFPLFCKLQDSPQKLKESFLKILDVMLVVAVPMVMGLITLADELTRVLFGPQWLPIVRVLQLISLACLFRIIHMQASYLFQAIGRPVISRNTALLEVTILFGLLVPFTLQWGITGSSSAVLIAMGAGGIVAYVLAMRLIRGRPAEALAILRLPLLASVLMSLAVFWLKVCFPVSSLTCLGLIIVAGMLGYGAVVIALRRGIIGEVRELVRLCVAKQGVCA